MPGGATQFNVFYPHDTARGWRHRQYQILQPAVRAQALFTPLIMCYVSLHLYLYDNMGEVTLAHGPLNMMLKRGYI